MRAFISLFVAVCLAIVGIALYFFSGFYSVAANVPHWRLTERLLEEVRDRSISFHSKGIIIPQLHNHELERIGFEHYHDMCRLCHGAPGSRRSEVAQGLNPAPPNLTSTDVDRPEDAEVYWIVKNGIKMTGMAAFGSTHTDEEIRDLVHFVGRLPAITPAQYAAMVKSAGLEVHERHHH